MVALDKQLRSLEKAPARASEPAAPPTRFPTVGHKTEFMSAGPASHAEAPPRAPRPAMDAGHEPPRAIHEDARFKNYLASSFQTLHPLRHERRLQRNKAIVMMAFVVLIAFLLTHLLRLLF